MDYPDDIAELERLLERVLGMVEQDEDAVARSDRPEVDAVFLSSSKKLRTDLRNRLGIATGKLRATEAQLGKVCVRGVD